MKFCDKLSMQRKKNNMSQEVLADRLGVSRQAVSKWESGTSMPDMERIMELCKVLDCNLDDLVDDGVINSTVKNEESKDNIINTYLKEGLGFVTKSLNMFWSMRFRDKVKCILELLFIALVMYLLLSGIYHVLSSIFSGLLLLFPELLYRIIHNVFRVIYSVFGLAVGIMLIIHIFKIRYLDYFVTVEDSSVNKKSIEKPVDEKKDNNQENKKFNEKKKNKIIIRDPKHSTYGFFDFLAGISIIIIKGILIFISMFGICSFMFLIFCLTFSFIKVFSGVFYLGTSILLLGALLVNYICLKIIYNFIFNLKHSFKKAFIIFIIGLSFLGIGFGISFNSYLSFKRRDISDIKYDVYSDYIDVSDNMVFDFNGGDIEYVTDDTLDNIKIEVTYDNDGMVELRSHEHYYSDGYYDVYRVYYFNNGNTFVDNFNYLIKKIDNKELIDDNTQGIFGYKIIGSTSNIEKLKDNYARIYN